MVTSVLGSFVTMISSQIMLTSVFKRLYFTRDEGVCKDQLKLKFSQSRKNINEEVKGYEFKAQSKISARTDDFREQSEITVQFDHRSNSVDYPNQNEDEALLRLKNELKQRRRYKANCLHKLLTFAPKFI